MYVIKSIFQSKYDGIVKPNYTRYGVLIPNEEKEIISLKEFFANSTLTEEQLLTSIRNDKNIFLENIVERQERVEKEKIENESTPEFKLEQKTKKDDEKRKMEKKINEFNIKKEEAQKTETKDDDIEIAKEEKILESEIKEVNNGTE